MPEVTIVTKALTGVGQATDWLPFEHVGAGAAHLAVTGTFVGTVDLEYSRGYIRMKASAFTSGTANVSLNK